MPKINYFFPILSFPRRRESILAPSTNTSLKMDSRLRGNDRIRSHQILIFLLFFLIGLIAQPGCAQPSSRLLLERRAALPTASTLFSSKQVLIKAHIVNIDRNYSRAFGLTFSTSTGILSSVGGFNMNLPAPENSSGELTIPIAQFSQGVLLDATLSALEKEGHAKLISDPQLMTLDRQTALIEAGDEVPYQEATEGGGTSVAFKKAVLRLKVTPEIQKNQTILLHLVINQDQVSNLTVNGVPAINTQLLQTQVLMKNHSTLVLGGILQENKSDQHQGIPFLSKIPWIGALFRYQKKTADRKQLLIFVTPIIVN